MKRAVNVSAEVKRKAVARLAAGEAALDVASDLEGGPAPAVRSGRSRFGRAVWKCCAGPGVRAKGRWRDRALRSAILNEGAAARRRIAELERKIGGAAG